MATTTLASSITKSSTYPDSVSVSAPNGCGLLCFIPPGTLTQQMICELPAINIYIKLSDGSVYSAINVYLDTVNSCIKSAETQSSGKDITYPYSPEAAYCIPLHEVPASCSFEILPIFDDNALSAHNNDIENGNVMFLHTTSNGIVTDGEQDMWTTPTASFPISIVFDDSKI